MLCTLLALCVASLPSLGGQTYSGRGRQLEIRAPRREASVVVDGMLSEPEWNDAARLTGFSRYAPTDGAPADDSTDVLVWYSPTAMHVGIRAYAAAGSVRATLADRDKIFNDDFVSLYIGTYNDGRQATVLSTNPLGIQGDGILVETGSGSGGGFGGLSVGRESVDQSPNFVFQSKGRVTDVGFEVEIRVPFKSLTYQARDIQTWTLNVTRKVQARGFEYSWAPAFRGAASFLGQSGHLTELTQLERGLVLDINPIVTSRVNGARGAGGGWDYRAVAPQPGLNVRWGITNNLTLNGTLKPDFAEVESDAGQFVFDPRLSLFFAERRPFFLDGIEQFSTPSNLVYTRRIIAPLAAAKVTGKVGGTSVAFLSAVDDPINSVTGTQRPVLTILRAQRDIGGSSRIGLLLASKEEGPHSNRVAGSDARLVFNRITSAQLQVALSQTTAPGRPDKVGPLWATQLSISTAPFGARYRFSGISSGFETRTGFISRPAVVGANADHRFTALGSGNALLQKTDFDIVTDALWRYDDFRTGRDALEKKLHFNLNSQLNGGWSLGGSVLIERFGFDQTLYADYAIERQVGAGVDTVPFVGARWLPNLDFVLSLSTPQFARWSFSGFAVWGRDENFFEWASGDIGFYSVSAQWRPTGRVRAEASYLWQYYDRVSDGTRVNEGRIPRLKVEYQLTRSIFLRLVGQYTSSFTDSLRNVGGGNEPILIRNGSGVYERTSPTARNRLRADWLFSYLPTPGTVLYAGYGSSLTDPDAFRLQQLTRTQDGFFVKMSYLFRL